MATHEQSFTDDQGRTKVIAVVAVIAALGLGGVFFFWMRNSVSQNAPPRLEGAIRAGSPEFETYLRQIVRDDPEADQSKRALGDWVMTLRTTVRNFTGKTITGLEMVGRVVDHDGRSVRERTMVVLPVPGRPEISELAPNRTLNVAITLDRITDEDDRANIQMEITGFRFKQ